MPSPVRGQSGDRPITQIPSALADMLAAALRGGVKATMGMPGDLEGLGRAGLNKLGAGVDPTPALPTSDFMNEWLPSDGGRMPTAEKLGEFLPLPMTLGAGQAAKQVAPMVKALRGAEAPVDMGRRDALQTMGKAGAGVAAAAVAPHMMVEALRAAPEAGAVAKAVAPTVAKAATGLSRAGLAKALHKVPDIFEALHGEVPKLAAVMGRVDNVPDRVMENLARAGIGEQDVPMAAQWMLRASDDIPEAEGAALEILKKMTPEEAMQVFRAGPDAPLPQHWQDAGVATDRVASEIFPWYNRGQPPLESLDSPLGKLGHPLRSFVDNLSEYSGVNNVTEHVDMLKKTVEYRKQRLLDEPAMEASTRRDIEHANAEDLKDIEYYAKLSKSKPKPKPRPKSKPKTVVDEEPPPGALSREQMSKLSQAEIHKILGIE